MKAGITLTREEALVLGFDLPKLLEYYKDVLKGKPPFAEDAKDDAISQEMYDEMTKTHLATLKGLSKKIDAWL